MNDIIYLKYVNSQLTQPQNIKTRTVHAANARVASVLG